MGNMREYIGRDVYLHHVHAKGAKAGHWLAGTLLPASMLLGVSGTCGLAWLARRGR